MLIRVVMLTLTLIFITYFYFSGIQTTDFFFLLHCWSLIEKECTSLRVKAVVGLQSSLQRQ